MKNLKYIFTGWPCGATRYIALWLSELGVSCGHECWDYKSADWYHVPDWLGKDPKTLRADSAYNWPQWFHLVPEKRKFGIMRDPLKVIASYLSINPEEERPNIINWLEAHWKKVEAHTMIFRVEHDLPWLCKELGIEYRQTEVSKTVNTHNRKNLKVQWNELNSWWNELGLRYGYR